MRYEDFFEYTDIDGDKFNFYQSFGEYYFEINDGMVKLPTEVLLKLVEIISCKCN